MRCSYLLIAFLVLTGSSQVPASVFFDWALIEDPGNPSDANGIGSVGYPFLMSKREVTNAQYVEFLNSVDPNGVNPNGSFNQAMQNSGRGGIIRDTSSPNGEKYRVKPGFCERPVNFVTFFDAMRFINWLHNGQGSGDTESGVYEISNGISELRSPTSKYFIPSENEWYKVAYYQSAADGGDTDNYWLYPTGTNSDPTPAIVDANGVVQNSGANVANFERGADWNGLNGNVTKVTDSGGASYYGVFDLAGNVMEWTEGIEGDSRILRGASWKSERPGLESNATDTWPPAITENNFGFRVAAPIPDPCDKGDFTADGNVDLNDISQFVVVLLNPCQASFEDQCVADMNVDYSVNSLDIPVFLDCVVNSVCP